MTSTTTPSKQGRMNVIKPTHTPGTLQSEFIGANSSGDRAEGGVESI